MKTTLTVDPVADKVDLHTIFPPGCVEMIPAETSKSMAIKMLVESLVKSRRLHRTSLGSVVEALIEREKYGTTALGKGLAFPHMRSRGVSEATGVIGYAPWGVNCDSLDGQPTRLILMVLSPFDQAQRHNEIMARIASLMSDKTLQYSLQIRRSPASLRRFLGFRSEAEAQL
jgi:mannitol/fructose-specific phosphotransferase system IIA component (Ntr-type)